MTTPVINGNFLMKMIHQPNQYKPVAGFNLVESGCEDARA